MPYSVEVTSSRLLWLLMLSALPMYNVLVPVLQARTEGGFFLIFSFCGELYIANMKHGSERMTGLFGYVCKMIILRYRM